MAVEQFDRFFEPVRKSIEIDCDPAHAFAVFTEHTGEWWPLITYSIYRDRAAGCGIEPRAGGEVFELSDDGERCVWGRVLDWAPPQRLVLSWHPGLPAEDAHEVEVRFTAIAGGTRVDLEHRGWHRLGERALRVRQTYEGGWAVVLASFLQRASGARMPTS